jgi:hypothetical protein
MDRTSVLSFYQILGDGSTILLYYMKTRQYNHLNYFLEDLRCNHTDWMRGQGEPPGWEDRYSIDDNGLKIGFCMNVV